MGWQDPDDLHRMRMEVFREIQRAGARGITCDEIEEEIGMIHQTCSARCTDLKKMGFVKTSGFKRLTRHGAWASVLVVNLPE